MKQTQMQYLDEQMFRHNALFSKQCQLRALFQSSVLVLMQNCLNQLNF